MLPGETINSGASNMCCGKKMKNMVLQSGAGYYIGTRCKECGSPNSRESGYYGSLERAQKDLESNIWERRY